MQGSDLPDLDFWDYPKPVRGKQELLAKAIGWGKGTTQVLDLSCGLAQDAYFFAQLGLNVLAIERNETIYRWISHSFEKSKAAHPDALALQRLEIHHKDSLQILRGSGYVKWMRPETALYFDPMFPQKKKSALPRKEMQIFQKVVGADEDSAEVLRACLQTAAGRVVVKRPLKAPPLMESFQHQFRGSTVRYDLYIPRPS